RPSIGVIHESRTRIGRANRVYEVPEATGEVALLPRGVPGVPTTIELPAEAEDRLAPRERGIGRDARAERLVVGVVRSGRAGSKTAASGPGRNAENERAARLRGGPGLPRSEKPARPFEAGPGAAVFEVESDCYCAALERLKRVDTRGAS